MRVLMLSDVESDGGAAVAACRLADGLARAGSPVTRVVTSPDGRPHPWRTALLRGRGWGQLIWDEAQTRSSRLTAFLQKTWYHRTLHRALQGLRPDVINVHHLHHAGWRPDLVEICARHAPTVWTLHDMWSFTGRCGYNYECRKFQLGCDSSCPTPHEYPALSPNLIAGAWDIRRRLLTSHSEMTAVAPSRWMAEQARSGLWRGHRVEIIPYGLPLDVFRPVDRALATQALGVETPGPVLLVSAHSLEERRKGAFLLEETLGKVSHRPLTLLTMGNGRLTLDSPGVFLHPLGSLRDDRLKVLAYSAAHVLIHPALADNLPLVVMEAMACGTPTVAFAVGGLPELIRTAQTGWIAPAVTPEALAETIDTALRDIRSGNDLRLSCRSVAEKEYSLDLQAERYLRLFRELSVAPATQGTTR